MYQNKALEIARELNAKFEISQSLLSIGQTLQKQGKTNEAVRYFRDAIIVSQEIQFKEQLKISWWTGRSYATMGDFKNAYTYDTLFRSIKDTLYNTDNDKATIASIQFRNWQKETEIISTTADQALKAATIQRQRIVNYAAAITGFLLILVILGFYNRYKYVRKTNKIIKDERDRSKELLLNILPEETARVVGNQWPCQNTLL
ncbi:MAG: tetratricopeptide repeat protein [Cytophagales bacterium]|nr:tetratricopeptide repeat protein [Cytophagales bacterium]